MKLSVVVPVYRVEATLDRCVESVLAQSVDDMEIILVDDGSPDRCSQMCDEWAGKDPRIKVIHKENGGLSDARNAGIEIARGDYITFVDSDDYISKDTYPALLSLMSDVDLLEYAIAGRLSLPDRIYDNADEYWETTKAYTHTYAWNKIYRRSLFSKVRYPKGKVFEDVYTLPPLLRECHRIATSSKGHYHYCYNPEGITAQANGIHLAQLLEGHLNSGMPIDDTYYMYLVNIQLDVCEQTGKAPILFPRRLKCSSLNGANKLKAYILNTFGINTLCRTIKLIHRFRKPSR